MTLRFRLRTLLIAATVIGCLFALPAWYDWLFRASITPLSDAEARQYLLFGETPIRPVTPDARAGPGERFIGVYRPRFVSVNRLSASANRATDLNNYFASYGESLALIRTERAETLERFVELFQQADRLDPKKWVMRGVVMDAAGERVPWAMVDLVGQYNHTGGCQTRDDGTFFAVIDFAGNPSKQAYRSRIRVRGSLDRWQHTTPSFTLTGGEVLQVRIDLPSEVAGKQIAPARLATGQ